MKLQMSIKLYVCEENFTLLRKNPADSTCVRKPFLVNPVKAGIAQVMNDC